MGGALAKSMDDPDGLNKLESAPAGMLETGLEVLDIETDAEFLGRRLHDHNVATQMEGMRRLARAFVENPDSILQELVNTAVSLCGADSSGISIEIADGSDERYYHWVATAGEYGGFMDAYLPREPSACGVCLERDRPQLMRVHPKFFEITGVVASTVTDGILLPWQVDGTRGTIWILAHGRSEAFDGSDLRLMKMLANFAAMGVRQQRQQKLLLEQAGATASAEMANHLAHQINNPLQGLTNLAYLAVEADWDGQGSALARELVAHVDRLSLLVKELLALPGPKGRE